MIKAIIFDSDGTLFHSNSLGSKTLKEVCLKFGKPFDQKKFDSTNGLTRKDKLKKLFPKDYKKMWPVWNKLYSNKYSTSAEAFFGVIKELQILSKKKILLFIYSTKYSTLVKQALKKFGVLHLFSEVIGGETKPIKPSKKPIQKLLNKYSLNKNEVLLVGDTYIDEKSAKNSGIKFVFIDYKNQKKTKLKYYKKIHSISELNKIIS